MKKVWSCLLILVVTRGLLCGALETGTSSNSALDSLLQDAFVIATINPDSGMRLLQQCRQAYIEHSDSGGLQECLMAMSEVEKINLNYSNAYDLIWDALALAEKLQDTILLAKVHGRIGQLYHIFGQEERSSYHLERSLRMNKDLKQLGNISGQELISSYFNMVMHSSWFSKHSNALTYLDTCFLLTAEFGQDTIKRGYLLAEKAIVLSHIDHDYETAERHLLEVKDLFESIRDDQQEYVEDKKYLVIIYSFLGDLKMWQGRNREALEYFTRSLEISYELNGHMAMRADLLYKSADMHARLDQHRLAYEKVRESRVLNDQIFGSRSFRNSELLEIKNKYREEIQKKNLELSEKSVQLLHKEKTLVRVKLFSVLGLLVIISAVLIIRNQLQRKRHKLKQKEAQDLLVMRNKELTSYALQFIEKEKMVTELLELIKKEVPDRKKYQFLLKSAEKGNKKYWDEFNMRFLSVNQEFYDRLRKKHPSLTSADMKLCALIKLDFSAKEMAHLLGISATSVNMSRYRLRKKMDLDRDVNLGVFIATI